MKQLHKFAFIFMLLVLQTSVFAAIDTQIDIINEQLVTLATGFGSFAFYAIGILALIGGAFKVYSAIESGGSLLMVTPFFFLAIFAFNIPNLMVTVMEPELVLTATEPESESYMYIWFPVLFVAVIVVASFIYGKFFSDNETASEDGKTSIEQADSLLTNINNKLENVPDKWQGEINTLIENITNLVNHSKKSPDNNDQLQRNNLINLRMINKLVDSLTTGHKELTGNDVTLVQDAISSIKEAIGSSSRNISEKKLNDMRINLEVIVKNLSTS